MATKTKKPKEKRPRQGHLEGMAPPSIEEIDKAAEAYREARDERMELTEEEVVKHQALLDAMHKHELKSYEYDGYTVKVLDTAKVKVKKKKEPKAEGEEE